MILSSMLSSVICSG